MLVLLEEEYGFRYWAWNYAGTKADLLRDWLEGIAPIYSPSAVAREFPALVWELKGPEFATLQEVAEATGHVHDDYDTYLCVDGKCYLAPQPEDERLSFMEFCRRKEQRLL